MGIFPVTSDFRGKNLLLQYHLRYKIDKNYDITLQITCFRKGIIMCGRYYIDDKTARDVEEELGLPKGALSLKAGDITPGIMASALFANKNGSSDGKNIEIKTYKCNIADKCNTTDKRNTTDNNKTFDTINVSEIFWGIKGKDKKLIINARAETVLEKTMFSESVLRRRCILPAAGFYEWDKEKNKVTFYRNDKSPIYLAGFYQLSENRDSFVVLTTAANESMIQVHDRMPLMIDKAEVKDWLWDSYAAKEMLGEKMPQLNSHMEYEQLSLF